MNRMTGGVILKENSKGWRNDYNKGGGCLFDYGPHCFDLSTYFFGTNVKLNHQLLKSVFSTAVDDIVYVYLTTQWQNRWSLIILIGLMVQ